MKKLFAVVLSLAMAFAFVACNKTESSSTPSAAEQETLTGTAQGYGGTVTVTVVREGDKIVSVTVDAPDETDGIGTLAIDELPDAIVAANGTSGVDAVAGATVTSDAIIAAFNNALNPGAADDNNDDDDDDDAVAIEYTEETFTDAPVGDIADGLRIGQAQFAAHGANSFAVTTVVLNGDVVVAAYIDEYQFQSAATATPVPNNEGVSKNYAEVEDEADARVLGSKRDNNETYSANMAERGGATEELAAGYDAIQDYVAGKTVAELEDLIYNNDDEAVVDAVAGSTLVDTLGYIRSVVEAARVAAGTDAVEFSGDVSSLKLGRAQYNAHGSGFAVAAAVVSGDTIVLSWIDEFQAMSGAVVGVPNSTAGFGDYWAPGAALVSKRVNNEYYSAMMAERGGSEVEIAANYDAIQAAVNGMTIAEAEALAGMEAEEAVDAIAGATVVDAANYVASIVEAAKAA